MNEASPQVNTKVTPAPKVSLIVPMYNCEDYVEPLLDNLCGQDFYDIEIICVDDGSKDGTLAALESYAKKDSRIRILHQKHKNAGAARNYGISEAKGEYLMFPDADDEYSHNYISRMYEAIDSNNADLAICQFTTYDYRNNVIRKNTAYESFLRPNNRPVSPESVRDIIKTVQSYPHSKIYRRDMIVSNGLRFSETKSLNDLFFSGTTLLSSKSIVFIPDSLFIYKIYENPNSISSQRGKNPRDMITVNRELFEWLIEKDLYKINRRAFFRRWNESFHNYSAHCTGEEFTKEIVDELINREPWKSMGDKELRYNALIYTAIARRLKKKRKKADNFIHEENNIKEIRRILSEEYGKDMGSDNYLSMRLAQIRQAGPVGTLNALYSKIQTRRIKEKK